MKVFLMPVLLLLAVMSLHAAPLSGIVSDNVGNPLPFVNVYIQGTTVGTSANENGAYVLDLAPGTYQIVYQFIGYTRQVKTITMTGQPKTVNVQMEPEDVKLKEIVVSGA